ncbi:hypothetical protein ABZ924_24015 [Streptomyces sp. NPDC046876]|uniref:hypothetical protein n=1 Tax=Streptomyces sp. NPDC046876 TaxID=3155616 RepID=UPI0033D3FF9B
MEDGDWPGAEEDPELRAWIKQFSAVLGHIDGVRGDAIYDLGQAQKDANSWNEMMNFHGIGAPLTAIPVAGDAIQRSVDVATAEYMNGLNAKVDAETRNNMINHYDNGEREMYAVLRQTAKERGPSPSELDASPGEYEDGLRPTAQQWYQNGIKDADRKMGERY